MQTVSTSEIRVVKRAASKNAAPLALSAKRKVPVLKPDDAAFFGALGQSKRFTLEEAGKIFLSPSLPTKNAE